jgi:hypothetical protein
VVNTVEVPNRRTRARLSSSFHLAGPDDVSKEAQMPKLTLKLTLSNVATDPDPLPPPPYQLGNRLVFTDNIIEINGKTIAPGVSQHAGFCFVVREPNTWLCQAGYTLPGIKKRHFRKGGQIQARGILVFPSSSTQPGFVAITGGTGDYRRASGEAKLLDDTHYELTIYTP